MLLDVIFFSFLTAFVCVGAYRGGLASGTSVVSLLLAYGGGVFCAKNFSSALAAELAISEVFATAAAGSMGFIGAFVVAGLLGSLLRGWDKSRLGEESRGIPDRAVGGLFGALRGGLVVLLLCWLVIWLR